MIANACLKPKTRLAKRLALGLCYHARAQRGGVFGMAKPGT